MEILICRDEGDEIKVKKRKTYYIKHHGAKGDKFS